LILLLLLLLQLLQLSNSQITKKISHPRKCDGFFFALKKNIKALNLLKTDRHKPQNHPKIAMVFFTPKKHPPLKLPQKQICISKQITQLPHHVSIFTRVP
jgi:hypothetical protein